MATKKKIILEGEIKTTIANAQDVTTKIQDFKKQLDALEMPKEATKAFEKAFDKVLKGLDEFEVKAGRGVSSLADTKELERAWKAIIKNIDGLEVALRGLNAGDIFPKEVKSNIESAQEALAKYVKKLAEARWSEAYKNKAKSKSDLVESKGVYEKELKRAKQRAAGEEGKYEAQRKKWGETEQRQYEAQIKALKDKTKARDEYLKTQKKAEKEALRDELRQQKYITKDPQARGGYRLNFATTNAIAGKEDSKEKEAAKKKIEEARNVLSQLEAIQAKEKAMNEEIADASKIVKGLEDQKAALNEAEKEWKDAQSSVEVYTKKIEDTESAIKQVDSELEAMSLDEAKKEWEDVVKVFQNLLGIDLSEIAQDAELAQRQLERYQTDEVEKLPNIFELLKRALDQVVPAAKKAEESIDGLNRGAKEMSDAEKELADLYNSILSFFSISNAVDLFKRAVRNAIETVKELDAVMTETAVVTDFSIGDMWDKLPEYASQASELGTSISELYGATTLYYQQGLNTNEAMSVGVETMKMARIASMDAEEATTAMTAALRGFNMEVNEMNAQRVSDVYSELAAISAADTNQIATAMGKTASIAASANMEFEATAAFLTQIIETTQEAPETAGTALKTIVARFTEVKELFSEGMLTGEDSEGEEININKIDEALRTVGISLKDFLNGSKGMDDIFLELASKWDSLDLATQRYIATAAAGSRQQSRFIAMMSNYDRTMELVDAANNSAGASQEQYAKTLESLQTSLQRLDNAWDTFTMGIADDKAIKDIVNALAWILEKINAIIEAVSGGNGLIKSLLSIGASYGVLKIGGSVLKSFGSSVLKVVKGEGLKAGETFSEAFGKSLKDNSKGIGSYFKNFRKGAAREKESIWGENFENLKFDEVSDRQKRKMSNDILSEFDEVVKGTNLTNEKIAEAKENFKNVFNDNGPQKGIETLNSALEGTEKKVTGLKANSKRTAQAIEASFARAGAIVAAVAVTFAGISNLLENLGFEKGAEAANTFASVLSVVASILTILPGLLKAVGLASLANPITLIIAAIGALIAAFVALQDLIETDEERLERLQEEAKKATEAAKEAKQAYDELLDKKSEYSTLQEELENLIRGTEEWREKLLQANQAVLQLLDTYPELSRYITHSDDGRLIIQESGWEKITGDARTEMTSAQTISNMANIEVTAERQRLSRKEAVEGIKANIVGLTQEQFDNIWTNAEKIIGMEAQQREELSYQWNIDGNSDSLLKAAQVAAKYKAQYKEEDLTAMHQLGVLLNYNSKASTSEYGSQVVQAISDQYDQQIGTLIEDKKDDFADMSDTEVENQYIAAGLNPEGKQRSGMIRDLAKLNAEEQLVEEIDNIIEGLENMNNQGMAKQLAAVISGDVSNLTEDELDGIFDNEGNLLEGIQKGLANLYGVKTINELAEKFGTTADIYLKQLTEPLTDLQNKMTGLSGDLFNEYRGSQFITNATLGQQQTYFDIASQVQGVFGVEAGRRVMSQMNKLLSDEKTRDEVYELLEMTDFRKEGEAEKFIEDLEKIGVNMEGINIDSFVADLNQLSASFKKFNLKSLIEETKEILDLADSLESRSSEAGLTDEERAKLLTMPGIEEEDFAWTGQEWIYLGDTMEGLSRALRENTEAILEQKMAGLEEQIATGEKLQEIFGDDNSIDFNGNWGWLSTGGWGWLTESMSLEEFLKGKEGSLTANIIHEIFGDEAGKTDEEAWAIWEKYAHAYNNLGTNRENLRVYGENVGTATMLSDYLGKANLSEEGAFEDYEKAVDAQERILGTQHLAEQLKEQFREAGQEVEGFDTAIRALAADLALQQRKMKSFAGTLDSVKDSLVDGKRDTEEYSAAWAKVVDSLKDVYGEEALEGVDISQELMENMVAGSEEAFNEVEKIIRDNTLQEIAQLAKDTSGIWDELQNALPDLQANITTGYNAEQLQETLGGIITQANKAGDEARAQLAEKLLQLGFQVTWAMDDETGAITGAVVSKVDRSNLFKNYYGSSGGGGGSKWENPYDKLYTTLQKINAELRLRERLEREYQRLLEKDQISSMQFAENSREQIASLEQEKKIREELLQGRRKEQEALASEYSDVAHYAWWDENYGVILNQEALAELEGSTDSDLTSKVDKYISMMEKKQDEIFEEIKAIDEIEDAVTDIKARGKDEFFKLEEQVKDALIFDREREIDKLTEINDTINDTNGRLISAMQESINKERQQRENDRTAQELEDKRMRLSQLQADTSGANALEILELQEEIANEEEAFVDTLVDQKIQELQDQNEKAYEQRQHQIEIMQNQLEFWQNSGNIWSDVNDILTEGFNPKTGIISGSRLEEILQNEANFEGLSAIGQQEWWKDFTSMLTAAFGYLEINQQLENIGIAAGTSIKFKSGNELLTGVVDEQGNVVTADGKVFNNVYQGFGGYYAGENIKEIAKPEISQPLYEEDDKKGKETKPGSGLVQGEYYMSPLSEDKFNTRDEAKQAIEDWEQQELARLSKKLEAQERATGNNKIRKNVQRQINSVTAQAAVYKQNIRRYSYSTGGLADFTGPAWLDGTKAKPEYVLNAAQTERFFALIDILDSWKNVGESKNIQNSGDNIVDIDINIETVKEEADVDMLAEKVQNAIVTSAQYRNNNFVRR